MEVSKQTLILLGKSLRYGAKRKIANVLPDVSYDIVCNVLRGHYYREDVVNEAIRELDAQEVALITNKISKKEQIILSKIKRSE